MAKYKPQDGVISFKKATKNMTIKEKLAYIFAYYKWLVIGVPLGLLILVYLVGNFINQKETYLQITIVNGFASTISQVRVPYEDLESTDYFYGFEPDIPELIDSLTSLLLSDAAVEHYEVLAQHLFINVDSLPILSTLAGIGDLDVVISYYFDFDAMKSVGHFQNIRHLNVMIPETVFINDYGISLDHTAFFDDYIHPTNPNITLILAIPVGSQRIDAVEDFLHILFE